ncbi:MAG: CpaD family pilus assembly protein [Alphaproteobacteria bacterium]
MHQQMLPLLALAAMALAACQSPFNGRDDALTVQSTHPISIDTKLVSASFDVGTDTVTLSDGDRERAEAFMADYRQRGLGKLSITAPSGTQNSAAAVQISAELSEIARAGGVRVRAIEIAPYRAPETDAAPPIVVSFTAYEATASGCGDFSRNLAFAPLNQPTPNFGCSTQHNLAAMVENPEDLVHPRNEDPADRIRRQTTLEKYRKGEATAAAKSDQGDGTSSEVKK